MEEASKEKEDLKRCGCLALIVGICWTSVHMVESLAVIWVQRSAILDGFIDLRNFIDSAVKHRHLGRFVMQYEETGAGLATDILTSTRQWGARFAKIFWALPRVVNGLRLA